MSSIFARHIQAVFCLGLIFALSLSAQSIEQEFQGIPWGSDIEVVKDQAKGTLKESKKIVAFSVWNRGEYAAYSQMTLGPEPYVLIFSGRYAERTEYYFSENRLSMVIHRPPYTQSFDAGGYVSLLQRNYKEIQDPAKEYIGNLKMPRQWGTFDMRREYPYTMEWESDEILIRVGCKAWPGKELREIKGVIYVSKEQRALNVNRTKELAEEGARQVQAARPPSPQGSPPAN